MLTNKLKFNIFITILLIGGNISILKFFKNPTRDMTTYMHMVDYEFMTKYRLG